MNGFQMASEYQTSKTTGIQMAPGYWTDIQMNLRDWMKMGTKHLLNAIQIPEAKWLIYLPQRDSLRATCMSLMFGIRIPGESSK